MQKILTAFWAGALLMTAACKTEKPLPQGDEFATIRVEFDNVVGGTNLYLGTTMYTNAASEDYTIDVLKYYVSNFRFYKTDGSEYVVPQDSSYFLIRENLPETRFAQFSVPEGDYSGMSFLLGIDSVRSTMAIDRRTGVLDPAGEGAGMYWNKNDGYIFFMLEGESDSAPVDADGAHKYKYHIGGYGGADLPTINNIKQINIDLSTTGEARARSGRVSSIHLKANISNVFEGLHLIRIEDAPTVMLDEISIQIADNYAEMFIHDRTEN